MGYTPFLQNHGPVLFASLNVGSVCLITASDIFYFSVAKNNPILSRLHSTLK